MAAKKVYILNTGYLETDKNNVVGGWTVGTKDTPYVKNEWIKLPVMAFLIETDDGYILYDTGSNPDAMKGYWSKVLQQIYPLYQKPEEELDKQLALCGVKPEDIKTVVISHMHLDHAGNLQLFPNTTVIVPKADFYAGQAQVKLNKDPNTHGGYVKGDMDRYVGQYVLADGDVDFELVPGVEVINLPGHTPGLLGLVVHLPNQTMILPQDCIYSSEIYGPPARLSGLCYDSISFMKSVEKVRRLQKKYNATVIYAHDEPSFKTYKLAPAYYD
ncbi:MAG: N-acyl homoserine lactonase family protein [Fusobacteriaceae bacterium]|jgi:glyoxylase-like metal-dependent hydrolase (beta-lactamase superfamily II)|nr:N-acyl homoserine lactonase family protein [Fusobacteriaceae bacterium]